MIDISARKTLNSNVLFKDEHEYTLNVVRQLTQFGFYDSDVVIHIHGFNSPKLVVQMAYETLGARLFDAQLATIPETDMPVDPKTFINQIGFWWPASACAITGFAFASMRVPKAARYLAILIEELEERKCRVVLQCHSLGCKVAIDAMRVMREVTRQCVQNVILCAAAVPMSYGDNFVTDPSKTNGLYKVLYSRADPVLGLAYRLLPPNWGEPAMGTLGVKESRLSQGTYEQFDMTSEVHTHGKYRRTPKLYDLILKSFGRSK